MDTTEIFDMIPAERGHMKQFAATIILLLVFGVTLYFCGGDLSIAFQAFYQAFILQIITTTITSLCYFMEEKNHLKTRYGNRWFNVIQGSLKLPFTKTVLVFASAIIFFFTQNAKEERGTPQTTIIFHMMVSIFTHCVFFLLGFHAPSKADISDISERKHLNVAHGLAWSYYFGYLKLVLPELDVKLAQYKREGRTFTASTQKLFILLPLSCHVTDTFSEQDQHISVDGNLSEIQRNRGGVSMRSFKHTVHRVLDAQNVEHYIVMEFATPLRSLHDMSNQTLAAFSTDDRLEQAKLFYCTLKKIIQSDIDIRNKVQLVLYDDTAEAKNPHFLSEKILKYVSPMADESPLQFSMEDQPQPLRSY
ncbi:stimulator of interferon genes protein isoform X2 [Petromyzon marinus]|uniref:stimulator of interferon genes protein isoform X2 n=1 Tax=Petromyzon marinus TaxID=7757 RepID=UPI003F6F3374